MGAEAYDVGYQTLLGPTVNILRSPEAGRNFEAFGAVPFLAAAFAAETITGIQSQNVSAMVKHLAANNQEHGRSFESSDMDDRAFREIYLPAFEHAVRARVGSVMCSYNAINVSHSFASGFISLLTSAPGRTRAPTSARTTSSSVTS